MNPLDTFLSHSVNYFIQVQHIFFTWNKSGSHSNVGGTINWSQGKLSFPDKWYKVLAVAVALLERHVIFISLRYTEK